MINGRCRRAASFLLFALCTLIFFMAVYVVSMGMPMQKLKITAVTMAEKFDISGTTDIYCLKPLKAGSRETITVKFMAVENMSDQLFTAHGTGQYVYMGCGELEVRHEFISVGRFLNIELTMNAAQTDLKLEDGTPFDITRYSLKPVLFINENKFYEEKNDY